MSTRCGSTRYKTLGGKEIRSGFNRVSPPDKCSFKSPAITRSSSMIMIVYLHIILPFPSFTALVQSYRKKNQGDRVMSAGGRRAAGLSLVGILAGLSGILAGQDLGFAISTALTRTPDGPGRANRQEPSVHWTRRPYHRFPSWMNVSKSLESAKYLSIMYWRKTACHATSVHRLRVRRALQGGT